MHVSRLFDSIIILAPKAYDRSGLVVLSGEHHVTPLLRGNLQVRASRR